jgi:hypothetical protein
MVARSTRPILESAIRSGVTNQFANGHVPDLKCLDCGAEYQNDDDMRLHVNLVHRNTGVMLYAYSPLLQHRRYVPPVDHDFACPMCDQFMNDTHCLYMHYLTGECIEARLGMWTPW